MIEDIAEKKAKEYCEKYCNCDECKDYCLDKEVQPGQTVRRCGAYWDAHRIYSAGFHAGIDAGFLSLANSISEDD